VLKALGAIAGARLVIALVIGGSIAVGGFFFRDFLTGSVLELRVGDCFDLPSSTVEVVSEVGHHPCNEQHDAELVGLFDYPGGENAAYPTHAVLTNFAEGQCAVAFRTYTRRDPYTDPELTVGWLVPTSDGWKDGDHEVSCHLFRVDEAQMTASYRAV
jgi:hypothetical protein